MTILTRLRASFVIRSFLLSFSGGMVSRSAVLATTFIAARSLAPTVFGQYVGICAAALLAAWAWDLGISTILTREYAAGELSRRKALVEVATLRLRASPVWFLTLVAAVWALDRGQRLSLNVVSAFAAASLFMAGHTALTAMLRARYQFWAAESAIACGKWLAALLSLSALPSIGLTSGLGVFALAMCAGEALTFTVAAILVNRADSPPMVSTPSHERVLTLRKSLPFAANIMLATAYNRFDVIFLSALSSVQQLGLYAPASRIQDLLYLLPGSLYAIALPMLSAASRKPNQSGEVYLLIRRFVGLGLLISIPTALAVFLFAGEMLRFVLGPAYMGSVTSTRILIWFLPMAAAGAPFIAALAADGHGTDTTKIFATAFGVALSLHLLLDPRWGAVGGAVASLLRDPLALLVAFLLARRAGLLRKPEPAVPAQGLLSSENFSVIASARTVGRKIIAAARMEGLG